MNIDTNNAFSGKVKFLQGGGGNTPVVEQVVPLLFGSNFGGGSDFTDFVELPLNLLGKTTQGSENKSFIVQGVVNGFKNWFVKSNLQFSSPSSGVVPIDIVVQLVIDGTTQDTQTLTIQPPGVGQIYQGEVDFNFESSPISITQSLYYRVDVSVSVDFRPNTTTLIYSSVFNSGLTYNGFLSNSFKIDGAIINNTNTRLEGNFGGSDYYSFKSQGNPNVVPFGSINPSGVYFSLSDIDYGSVVDNKIRFTLYVDAVDVAIALSQDISSPILPNTFYYCPFDNGTEIGQGQSFYLMIDLLEEDFSTIQFQEIGLIYSEDV